MTRAGRPGWWFTAAVLVLGAHLVGATTLARRPTPVPVPPEATVVELLPPEPAAGIAETPTELTENLPALPQLAELDPPEFPEPEPEPEPEPPPPEPKPEPEPPQPEPEPEPEPLPEPEPEPVVEPVVEPIETIAAVRPRARPPTLRRIVEPRETPQKPEPQRERRQEQPREQPRQAQTAPARTQPAPSAAGSAGQAARVSGQAVQSWENKVRQATARHMSRARVTARGQLAATVLVRIDGGGGVQASLAQGSGDPGVDAALMRHASRLPRMPAPPDRQAKSVVVPFRITR